MEAAELVRMANQIAAYFRAYDAQEAVAGMRTHLHNFWSPDMRRSLGERRDDPALSPLARTVAQRLADEDR